MALTDKQLKQLRRAPVSSGNRLLAAIALAGTSQVKVAAALGLPVSYVGDVVRGRWNDLGLTKAHRFAQHFGCAIEDLFPARERVSA